MRGSSGVSASAIDPDYYLTPIDQCYKLVGLLRTGWRGLSGGSEVWVRVQQYFDDLRRLATAVKGQGEKVASHA